MNQRIQRARRSARALMDAVTQPPWVRPGHFYSPVPNPADVERALSWQPDVIGIDIREPEQLALFSKLVPLFEGVADSRYDAMNDWYNLADASIYQAMVRLLAPRKVVEVGSGYSTAKLLDTAATFLPELEITCIEPYPERLTKLLRPNDRVEIIASPVQDVPLTLFSSLQSGDILFIDSTHVAKAGSDVLWLYLHVLPRLAPGVVVHIHDIFWPFEYPADWLRSGRQWNENYFLQAFLCHNNTWQIELFSAWLWQHHSTLVPGRLKGAHPGSIWIRRHETSPQN